MLLTYWTALAFVSRRAALLAGLMMAVSIMLGVEARLAKTDAVLLLTAVAAMGAMARVYLARAQSRLRSRLDLPAIFWTALAAGILIKGPLIVMFVALTVLALAVFDRSVRWLAALRPFAGRALALSAGAAVVFRHRQPLRLELLCRIGRPRSDEQVVERPGGPWRAAGLLFRAVLGDVLAGRDARRHGGAERLGGAAREGREIPAVLDRAGLDRDGAGGHQAAALRAAALSGDCDPDRRRHRSACAGAAAVAGSRHRLVVLLPADPRHRLRSSCW